MQSNPFSIRREVKQGETPFLGTLAGARVDMLTDYHL